jgi:hypothetical protein
MDGSLQDPVRGIQVTMLLAEFAAAPEGKLTVFGGGWNTTGPNAPCAIGMVFYTPWHLTNQKHEFRLELIDMDGNGVGIQGQEQPLVAEGQFEVGRPPGAPAGTTFPVAVPLNLGPLGLPPHQRYEFRLQVDGQAHEDWRLVFNTIPPIQGQQREAA